MAARKGGQEVTRKRRTPTTEEINALICKMATTHLGKAEGSGHDLVDVQTFVDPFVAFACRCGVGFNFNTLVHYAAEGVRLRAAAKQLP
jgi:hypothetical protein